MKEVLWYIVFWNSIQTYLIAIGIFVFLYFLTYFFKNYILKKAQELSEKTSSKVDDAIVEQILSISKLFYIALWIYIPFQYIKTDIRISHFVEICFLIIVAWQLSNSLINIIKQILDKNIYNKKNGKKDTTRINLFHLISKILIYIIWWLFLLSNIWVEITPLIASLWIVWISIAFALQKILGDVFSSFSIFLDRPFEIGDFVSIWKDSGTIKDIWIKSTRIQTLQWQELIIPNSEITGVRINNYGKMKKRRVVFSIWVVYKTSPELIEKIPTIIQNIIENLDDTSFDRAHFVEFGKSELIFDVVYYITNKDFKIYRDTHQKICLEIMKTFKKKVLDSLIQHRVYI